MKTLRALLPLSLFVGLCCVPGLARADLYINEIFFDVGGNGDENREEFIELRGPANMDLTNHYLIFIENEDNSSHTGPAGQIDNIFDLGAYSMGSNGFLTLRMSDSLYSVAPGTTDLVNTGAGPGYGSGAGSSIGAEDDLDEGRVEAGGFTAMLFRNDGDAVTNAPQIAFDLDVGNDGLDNPTGQDDWHIYDSIGIHGEAREAVFGRTYAPINYGFESIGQTVIIPGEGFATADPGLEPGAEYVALKFEIEYLARWGNSTGSTDADWHISNITDKPGSGFQGPVDWRQSFTGEHEELASGDPNVPPSQPTEEQGFLESSQNVPYGTKLLNTLGAPNFILGDHNGDGYVDAADYTVWRDTLGDVGSETIDLPADMDHDFVVDQDDYDIWANYYGGPDAAPSPATSGSIPEPSSLVLLAIAGSALAARFR